MTTDDRTWFKDPDDVLDYTIDYDGEDWLGSDTIATSSWVAETGITIDSDTNDTTTTTVWLSGGTADTNYIVTNSIVTAAGREKDESLYIRVKEN